LQGVCHGELIIEYHATPLYNVSTNQPIPGTGLFKIEQPKPRTVRYTLLPSSLAFRTTPNDDILLEDNIFLTIVPPEDGVATDLNPLPENFNGTLPARLKQYTWSDAILVKFSVVFQVEEALEAEVTAFFQGLFGSLQSMLTGPYGIALISHEKRGAA
jgi:ABC-type transport system substrate-binding protein